MTSNLVPDGTTYEHESIHITTPTVAVSLDDGAYMPERAHEWDAGADLRTPIGFTVPAGGSYVLHSGVHMQTPRGYAALLKSKSGLNVRYGILTEGVIDHGYDGEIVVKLYNHGDADIEFRAGDKVTQVVIVPVYCAPFREVPELTGGDRGSDGFGSTGR